MRARLKTGTGPHYGQRKWSKKFEKGSREFAERTNGHAESKEFSKKLLMQVRIPHKGSCRYSATINNYFIWAAKHELYARQAVGDQILRSTVGVICIVYCLPIMAYMTHLVATKYLKGRVPREGQPRISWHELKRSSRHIGASVTLEKAHSSYCPSQVAHKRVLFILQASTFNTPLIFILEDFRAHGESWSKAMRTGEP